MKNLYIFIFLLFAITLQAKPVVIKGKISGKLPDVVYYSAPVNNSSGFDIAYSTKPDANGNFTITCDINKVAFIDIYADFNFAASIIAEPGNQYGIAIIADKDKASGEISANNSEVQKLYNTILGKQRMASFYDLARELTAILSVEELEKKLNDKEQHDIDTFKKLLNKKAISPEVFKAFKEERKFHYILALAYDVIILKSNLKDREEAVDIKPFFALWEERQQFKKTLPEEIATNPYGFHYLNIYLAYKQYEKNNFAESGNEENNDQAITFKKHQALIGNKNHEYYIAANLSNMLSEGLKDETLLAMYEEFKITYPKSTYLPFLTAKIAPLITFNALPTTTANAVIMEDYNNINSFKELIAKFPGKKLYIDVWATSCGPCRDEFKHNGTLYAALKEQDVTVIYISTDEDKRDNTWKKMINHYGLQGHHVRANKQLHHNLGEVYGKGGTIWIPWHMLVGTDGSIKKMHVAGGSDPEELKKQLTVF